MIENIYRPCFVLQLSIEIKTENKECRVSVRFYRVWETCTHGWLVEWAEEVANPTLIYLYNRPDVCNKKKKKEKKKQTAFNCLHLKHITSTSYLLQTSSTERWPYKDRRSGHFAAVLFIKSVMSGQYLSVVLCSLFFVYTLEKLKRKCTNSRNVSFFHNLLLHMTYHSVRLFQLLSLNMCQKQKENLKFSI